MVDGNTAQNVPSQPSSRHKIVFQDDVKNANHQWRDLLGGWLSTVEGKPELGERVKKDCLLQQDLFWLNDYCRHMVGFNQRPFQFSKVN